MGLVVSALITRARRKEVKLVMVGLDAAGKTTVLYKMSRDVVVNTIPTFGFNAETWSYKKLRMTCWDLGGQEGIRKLWRHYVSEVHGIIFVVDSVDRGRMGLACRELQRLLREDTLRKVSVLVLANKQDLPAAMSVAEITEKLRLPELCQQQWSVQGACATKGDGLHAGLDWLATSMSGKLAHK
eukprot:CAMPEP_0170629054 /NCGR_PEP_ID=MMETSP0224-20130122/33085_1 /TAXON_ID=285029 /ORGANISM="Togula jolla, Strain CCCM 725" /LENGTH=183 /DNA_ID=CAMNT_0010956665 /DNA_START=62 /DNA_END=613 /DNA_ORIENTATION=+